jgi:hypothetical protein
MLEKKTPYRQFDGVLSKRRLEAEEALLIDAWICFMHDENMFATDTNMMEVHVNWKRRVYKEQLENGVVKTRSVKEGGEYHPGRSRGSLTLVELTDFFMRSLYYMKCARGKAKWTVEKTKKHLCRCLKVPLKEVCVDPIKGNAKHSTKAARALIRRISESSKAGTRRKGQCEELLELFKTEYTLSNATMCPKILFAGMELRGTPLLFHQKACAFGTCKECGVDRFFKKRLENLRLSLEEKTDICRFESVERHWGTVQELTKRTVTLREALAFMKKDMKAFNVHCFKDRWSRWNMSMMLATQGPNMADGRADFAAGMSFCSIESITCVPDNFAYLEVIFVSVNRRTVAGVEIFTNLVFYFFGEAASKYKSNDAAAHIANQKHVLEILMRDYGITEYRELTDGCKGQFVCKANLCNVAEMDSNNFGIDMEAFVCEPACGKSQCDGANNEATRIIQKAVKDGDYVPRGFEGWLKCRGKQPKQAKLYKQWEVEEDAYNLKNKKGQFGVDKHYWFFTTSKPEEFDRLNSRYPGEIVFVEREQHWIINAVPSITKNRAFAGQGDKMLGIQEAPCHCLGCQEEKDGVPNCMHDDISGRSRRSSVKMNRVKGIAHKLSTFEEHEQEDGKITEKEAERVLVKAEVIVRVQAELR